MKMIGEIAVKAEFNLSAEGVAEYNKNPTPENLFKVVLKEVKNAKLDYTRIKIVNKSTDNIEVCLK